MQGGDIKPWEICHQLRIWHKTKCMSIIEKERSQRLRSLSEIEKTCFVFSLIGMGSGYITRRRQ